MHKSRLCTSASTFPEPAPAAMSHSGRRCLHILTASAGTAAASSWSCSGPYWFLTPPAVPVQRPANRQHLLPGARAEGDAVGARREWGCPVAAVAAAATSSASRWRCRRAAVRFGSAAASAGMSLCEGRIAVDTPHSHCNQRLASTRVSWRINTRLDRHGRGQRGATATSATASPRRTPSAAGCIARTRMTKGDTAWRRPHL